MREASENETGRQMVRRVRLGSLSTSISSTTALGRARYRLALVAATVTAGATLGGMISLGLLLHLGDCVLRMWNRGSSASMDPT
jgi:hypothetical protein